MVTFPDSNTVLIKFLLPREGLINLRKWEFDRFPLESLDTTHDVIRPSFRSFPLSEIVESNIHRPTIYRLEPVRVVVHQSKYVGTVAEVVLNPLKGKFSFLKKLKSCFILWYIGGGKRGMSSCRFFWNRLGR